MEEWLVVTKKHSCLWDPSISLTTDLEEVSIVGLQSRLALNRQAKCRAIYENKSSVDFISAGHIHVVCHSHTSSSKQSPETSPI